MFNLFLSVGKSLFYSFLAKPILMKFAFYLLELAAKQTDNELDDAIVQEAKQRYYGTKNNGPENNNKT